MAFAAETNHARVDLNLLRVFEAVYEERNLIRASKRLHLSQSAVSHALGRLREAAGDELFVRTAKGMEPTARAIAMAVPTQAALRSFYDALGVRAFDSAASKRQFVLAANDYVTSVLLADLARDLALCAPGIDIVVRPSTRLDLAEQIDVGRIDLAVGVFAHVPQRLQTQAVWTQRDLLVMRKGHPMSRRPPKIANLADYPLVTVSLGGAEEGAVDGYIVERGLARQSEMFDRESLEAALRAQGLKPRYRVTVPHALAVPQLLAGSDMISILPGPLAITLLEHGHIAIKPLPYVAPEATLRALWHARNERDPAQVWLRQKIFDVGGKLAKRWLKGADSRRNAVLAAPR